MNSTTPAEDIVRKVFAALRRQDLDSLLSLCDRDVVVRQPRSLPHGGEHHGLDQARAAAIGLSSTWAPYQEAGETVREPEVFPLSDDQVAARWRLRARDDAGNAVDVEAIDIYRLRDGRVLELETYYRDTAALVRFLEGRAAGSPPTREE